MREGEFIMKKVPGYIVFMFAILLACIFTVQVNAQEAQSVPEAVFPQGDFSALQLVTTAQIDQVIDPLRVQLADRRIIQLMPLTLPGLDSADPGPEAAEALAFLKQLLEKKQVRIYQVRNRQQGLTNRMGYMLAHLELKDSGNAAAPGTWVQGALLANGYARIRPSADNTEMAAQMLALEEQARNERRGLWADQTGPNKVYNPDNAEAAIGSWAIVEGRVRTGAQVNNQFYLNFGQDWRSDFTIGISPDLRRQLSQKGINASMDFAGQRIRVHGWVESYNGPFIRLLHPAWIEILPDQGADTKLAR